MWIISRCERNTMNFFTCAIRIVRPQWFVLTIALFSSICHGQGRDEDLSGLFPVVFNLATRARISTNATCGESKPEVFCKLVDHIEQIRTQNLHCDICDARSTNPDQRHPIRNAVDGSERWWQSPSLANGRELNEVSITLELGGIYQIAYLIVKAANSPRPGNWILERSLDGQTFKPWQYFAMTDQECRNFYGVEPTIGVPTFLADDQVICTSRYSALNPLEGGEIFVSLVNGRPGVFQPSPLLLDFTSAKYIRLRFQKIRTLHADLMTFNGLNRNTTDASVTRRYYYSVKDISIGGQCICYGHAAYCRRHQIDSDRLQCQCLHNTAGDNCEYCLPKFNQKPWQVGGIQNIGCEECNCHNKADECVYNATADAKGLSLNMNGKRDGGGVCLNCKEFTTGINCEKCIDGYFQRPGMTPDMPRPCQRCSCVETATSTSQCVPDNSMVDQGLNAGDCICKEGFVGRSCDSCAEGYHGYPRCRPCRCKTAGTLDPETCDQPCICKDNVAGSKCDRCKPGHFNLQKENVFGCTECFCFGVSRSCESVGWGLSKVADLNDWKLSTLKPGGLTLLPRLFDNWLEAKTYLLKIDQVDPRTYSQDDIHYWNAPMTYLGNRLSSYGGNLVFTLKYILDDRVQNQYHLREPNVVIEGSNISLTADDEYLREIRENSMVIPLHEDHWYHLSDGSPATRDDMMKVLYRLERLLIRATHHTAQDTVYLKDVFLDAASPLVMDGSSLLSVEQCRCPTGYAGLSCESCPPGWRRVNNQLFRGRCEKCQCNNHASECDPYTGKCLNCKHSTHGNNCESCLPGFYGDPSRGTSDDCKPCGCPLVSGTNFFAKQCKTNPDDKDNYECLNCQEGYTGVRCQECAPGYYGDPVVPGGSCRKCSCGGNIEEGVIGNCDKKTGVCNLCANNTEGEYCEKCRRGFYGSAVNGDCRPCQCSDRGSTSTECNTRTGQCDCRGVYAGRKCDRCQALFGNVDAGCEPCNCHSEGSPSRQCDTISGQCPCRKGVDGQRCEKCKSGHYDFSRSGCKACDCYGPGTNNSVDCDSTTGRCICRSGVTGKKCDSCRLRHFGLLSGSGCSHCDCDRMGSRDMQCSESSGQCNCKPGVTGRRCNQCVAGYYGFSRNGCKRCKPCTKKGHVCNIITGECSCPPNTEGPNCEKCVSNCWGHNGEKGCKQNVMGKQCDRCRPGTFSLNKDNPKGCTECYCFLRGRSCRQAPYLWTTVDIPSQMTNFLDNQRSGLPVVEQHGFLIITGKDTYVPKDLSQKPIYWKLDSGFSSDLILSYAGKLSFVHYFEGDTHLPLIPAPLVVLVGNGFVIETGSTTLEPTNPLQFNIPLHEDVWTLHGKDSPIDRKLMMVVLQNVEAILIRATQDGRASYAEIGPITLQTAVLPGPNITSTEPALGVELCDCPKRYSGTSCQNPGDGFFRVKPDDTGGTNPIGTPETVVGHVKRCQCFGHSKGCDSETGICQGCQHNTTGDKCEVCAEGFYGVATMGQSDDCKPCACPLEEASNNFSPTCIGSKTGMMCSNCLDGYIGIKCEKCAPGYYGDPETVGDSCKPCMCNPEGSSSDTCDPVTGQCPCLSGISGRDCNECTDFDSGVVEGKCVSCYTGCTGILLADLANMTVPSGPGNTNISLSDIKFPWERLYETENKYAALRDKFQALESAGIADLDDYNNQIERFNDMADKLNSRNYKKKCLDKASTSEPEACKIKENTEEALEDATKLEKEVEKLSKDIIDMIEGLDELVERLLYNQSGVNMTEALEKAKMMLDKIENRNFTDQDKATRTENQLAEELSEKITNLTASNFNTSEAESSLQDLKNRLEDLVKQTNTTDVIAKNALDMITQLRDLLARLKSIKDEIDKINKDSHDIINEAEKLLEQAEENLIVADGNNRLLDTGFDYLIKQINKNNRSKEQLTELYEKAIEHVLGLMKQAEDLEKLFAKTRNISEDAVKAAKAYESIVDAIKEANKSANNALKNAKESVDMANVSDLEKEVEALINKSKEQLKESNEVLKNASGLQSYLDNVNKNLTETRKSYDKAKETAEEMKKKLSLLPSDLTDSLKKINDTNKNTMDVIDETLGIVDKFNSTMGEKMKKVKDFDIAGFNFDIGSEISRAKDGKSDADDVVKLEKEVEDKAQAAIRKTSSISYDLDRLKEKIRDARSRVNDMKMSLQADGQCHRSYRSPLSPSSTNEIRLGFKVNNTITDMLMVLLQQSPQAGGKEFLAAEIKDSKVKFTWNSGKGQGSVSHSQDLEPQKWYQLIAKRVGSVGQLKVWNIDESTEKKATQETASIGAGCSLMGLNEESTVMLAGSSDLSPIPTGITRQNFVGCLGDVSVDTNRIGVYNFKTNEPQHCGACKEIPQVKVGPSRLYIFSGYGFAQFAVQNYNSKRTKVELEFKTFYEDAGIFFVGNPDLGDFLSIELRGGHVSVHFNMGGLSFGSGQTTNIYNNNKWTRVIFDRNKLKAALKVDSELILMKAPGPSFGLELSGSPMFFGGLPSKFRTEKFRDLNTTEFFYGCMNILNFGSLVPDDDTSTLVNVEASSSCRENGIHNVAFRGDGYLILQNDNIKFSEMKNDISLTFITSKPDGVLLIARDPAGQNYYSISLVDGALEARMKSERTAPVTIKSSEKLNDEKMHCVSLIKDGRNTELVVDDKSLGKADSRDITGLGDLYLGGLPVDAGDITPTNEKLDGCISDVIANGVLLSMSDAKQYKRADVGRCRFTDNYPPAPLAGSLEPTQEPTTAEAPTTETKGVTTTSTASPTTTPLIGCVPMKKAKKELNAKSVGNEGSFYAEIGALKRRLLAKSLNFSVDFRTFYPDGSFGYLLNADKDKYFGIQLKDEQLQVKYTFGPKPVQIDFPNKLSDGKWHTMSVVKTNEEITVTLDNEAPQTAPIPMKLDIKMPLHVGGAEKPSIFTDNNIDLVPYGIRGCIRNFIVVNKPLEMEDHTVVRDVSTCYENVQPGVQVTDGAWGMISDEFEIKPVCVFDLEFRTNSENGLLLTATDANSENGFTLELFDGQMWLNFNKDGTMYSIYSPKIDEYNFCDNKWHSVRAGFSHELMFMFIDGVSEKTEIKKEIPGGIKLMKLNRPLFIGSHPDGYPQATSAANAGFDGCMRKLKVNHKFIDWYDDIVRSDSLRRTSCPV